MNGKSQSNIGFLFLIAGLGIVSCLAVIFALRVLSQKLGSSPDVGDNYLQVQQDAAIGKVRKQITAEFINSIVNCSPIQTIKNQILNEQQVAERVTAVLENDEHTLCRNDKNHVWSFTAPCTLAIHRPPAWLSGVGNVNLGNVNICATTVAGDIHYAADRCSTSSDFSAFLVNAVLADNEVQKEFDKVDKTP